MTALESKASQIAEEKLLLADKLSQKASPKKPLAEIIELLRGFLSNPWNIYENGSLAVRKSILKMAFASPLAYDRKNSHKTPQVLVIF